MCSNFYFAKAKRFYLFQKFWNKTKTLWCVPTFFLAKAKHCYLIQKILNKTKTFWFSSQIYKTKIELFEVSKKFGNWKNGLLLDQKFWDLKENVLVQQWILFKKWKYSIVLGTFVGKRTQTILKKRWFDITTSQTTWSSSSPDIFSWPQLAETRRGYSLTAW